MAPDSKELQEGITNFLNHIYSQIDLINSLPNEHKWLTHKKAFFVTIIDSIGGIAYPELRHKNTKRFQKTILTFGKWPHASYFSLPYVHQYLKINRSQSFDQLRDRLVNPAYAPWLDERCSIDNKLPWIDPPNHPRIVSLNADVPEDAVLALLTDKDALRKLCKFQHYSLLYEYRNFLVHSFVSPGINDRFEVMNYPYYEQWAVGDDDVGKCFLYYELIYSSAFIHTLAKRVLANASDYFRQERINPYFRLQGSVAIYWHDELNVQLGLGERMIDAIRKNPRNWQT